MQQKLNLSYWLRQFPTRSNMDDRLHNAVAVIVDETQRTAFIRNRQRELVVIDQTNLSAIFQLKTIVTG